MRTKRKSFLTWMLAAMTVLASLTTVANAAYKLGTITDAKACPEPGVLLNDGATCYWDPAKYIVNPTTKTWERRLPLGMYPVNTDATASVPGFVTATACTAGCRTCLINEDFANGVPGHCTSCDLHTKPFLHLAAVPTCVAEQPAKTALVVVQNGRLLGVSNEATPYGGMTSTGARTPRASADPLLDRETNTKATSTNPSANLPVDTPVDQSTLSKETKIAIGKEASLQKVMDTINQKGVLGIGKQKDNEEKCINSVLHQREPRNYQPNIVYLAIPCPENCDECHVTKYGSLYCTKAATSKYLKEGLVADACILLLSHCACIGHSVTHLINTPSEIWII